jgi:hypothetical protein
MSPSRAFESNGYENYIFSASGDRQHCGNLSLRQGRKNVYQEKGALGVPRWLTELIRQERKARALPG